MAITPTDYSFRQLITGTAPAAAIGGMVLLIDENSVDPDFWNHVQNGGGDIRVCEDFDGLNQLPINVVTCDTVGNALQIHTRKPGYTPSGRDVYIFCGTTTTDTQPAANSPFGRNAVYQDAQFNTNDGLQTESSNGYAVASDGAVTTTTDQYGNPIGALDSPRQRLTDSSIGQNTNNFTVECWHNGTSNGTLMCIRDGTASRSWQLFISNGSYAWVSTRNASLISGGSVPAGWNKIVATVDSGQLRFYVNGVLTVGPESLGTIDVFTDVPLRIGYRGQGGIGSVAFTYNGDISNATVSGYVKTASQISLEHDNQRSASTFWTQSAPDNPSAGAGTVQPISLIAATQNESAASIDISTGILTATTNAVQIESASAVGVLLNNAINTIAAKQLESATGLTLEQASQLVTQSAIQNESAGTLTINQSAGQTLNLVNAAQNETATTLTTTQKAQIATIVAAQLEAAGLVNIETAQAITMVAAEQFETASTIALEQIGGQIITLLAAEQFETSQPVLLAQKLDLSFINAQQSDMVVALAISEMQQAVTINANQLETASLLSLIQGVDKVDFKGIYLVPITEVYSLEQSNTSNYSLEEQ